MYLVSDPCILAPPSVHYRALDRGPYSLPGMGEQMSVGLHRSSYMLSAQNMVFTSDQGASVSFSHRITFLSKDTIS